MKKTLSIIMSLALLAFACGIETFATISDDELDLSQYTIEDIASMSADELDRLIADFERIVDPFDTYRTNPVARLNKKETNTRWSSGDYNSSTGEIENTGTHESITATACGILNHDKGFFGSSTIENISISLMITLASLLPDSDEIGFLFDCHFYDPTTEENFLFSTTNTAKTKTTSHFQSAITAMQNNNPSLAYEHLGRALHFLQDAGQPQHASNFTNLSDPSGYHHLFEAYADNNKDTYLNNFTTIIGYDFYVPTTYAYVTHTATYYVKQCATRAYAYKDTVNTTFTSQWGDTALKTMKNAAAFSALLMYQFAGYAGITLS